MESTNARLRRSVLGFAVAACCACTVVPPKDSMPEGWTLVYQQDFESHPGLDFVVSDPAAWRIGDERGNHFLEQFAQSAYTPPYRSPLNIAVLTGPYLGDFVLEVDVQQTGREYAHRDACILFGFQDPAHFLYAHLASSADDNAHQVQLVAAHDRVPVTQHRSFGVAWGEKVWHHVRVERSVEHERVRVFFDHQASPVLEARGEALQEGWIGLGTFDDSARFDNLRLWAPEHAFRSPGFFAPLK